MKPTGFEGSNAGGKILPKWSDGKRWVTCWKMSWKERVSALLFGRLWDHGLESNGQPATYSHISKKCDTVTGPPCRCYVRGETPLGLFNTVIGCVFNRVLVKTVDTDTGRIMSWFWDKATDHCVEPD